MCLGTMQWLYMSLVKIWNYSFFFNLSHHITMKMLWVVLSLNDSATKNSFSLADTRISCTHKKFGKGILSFMRRQHDLALIVVPSIVTCFTLIWFNMIRSLIVLIITCVFDQGHFIHVCHQGFQVQFLYE